MCGCRSKGGFMCYANAKFRCKCDGANVVLATWQMATIVWVPNIDISIERFHVEAKQMLAHNKLYRHTQSCKSTNKDSRSGISSKVVRVCSLETKTYVHCKLHVTMWAPTNWILQTEFQLHGEHFWNFESIHLRMFEWNACHFRKTNDKAIMLETFAQIT